MRKIKNKPKTSKKIVKKSTIKKQRCHYKKEHLKLAVEEVLNGKSIAESSRKYQVPESTIRARKVGKYADKPPGPCTVLSPAEENELVAWIFYCSKQGFPIAKHQLLESVKLLCDHDGRKTPFVNNKPGRSWFDGFLNRHSIVSERIAENVSLSRAKVSENNIRSWFTEITSYLTKEDLVSIDSSRIFNSDETGVSMNPKPPTVLAPKGCKNVYKIVNNNEKENITVLVTANAAGTLAPTLVLFAGESVPKDVIKVAPPNYAFGHSENGWMTSKNFYEYIGNVFYPWLKQSKIELPVIFYVDGHSSHITLPLSEFCLEKKIILIALCPNATHILQPLDVSLFRSFKIAWQKSFQSFCQSFGSISIKKSQFSLVLEKTFENLDLKKILVNGFKACGLYPLNANAIDYQKVFRRLETSHCETSRNFEDLKEVTDKPAALIVLESLIDKDKLKSFQTADTHIWSGNEEDKSLFKIWYELAKSTNCIDTKTIDEICNSTQNDVILNETIESLPESSLGEAEDIITLPSINDLGNLDNTTDERVDNECDRHNRENDWLELVFDKYGNLKEDISSKFRILADLPATVISSTPAIEKSLTKQKSDPKSPNLQQTPIVTSLTLTTPSSSLLSPTRALEILKSEIPVLDNCVQCPRTDDPEIQNFSEPFKKLLHWPKCDLSKKKSVTNAKKAPSVLSSAEWQSIQQAKENQKRMKEKELVARKKIKLEKQELKKQENDRKEEERLSKEKIRLEKEKEKILKQQQKIKDKEAKQKVKEEVLLKKKETAEIKKKIVELQKKEAELEKKN